MRTILLILLSYSMQAQVFHDDTLRRFIWIDSSNTSHESYECWRDHKGQFYNFKTWGGYLPTDIACYKNDKNDALIVKDTMATIRLFYLDILQKRKQIEALEQETYELSKIITSIWYTDLDPRNKKVQPLIKKYNKKYPGHPFKTITATTTLTTK